MTIAMTPAQFSTLSAKLTAAPGITFTPVTNTSGAIITSDVTLSYVYDGTAQADVEVTERHSFLARHASESTIKQHVNAEFEKWIA